VNYSPVLN